MDQLDALRVFVAVAEARGFAAAARRLGLSAASVTRSLQAIESDLGVILMRRTTRSLHLTEVGERFLTDCRRILADIDEARAVARGDFREPRGQLAITAPSMFGRLHVLPLLLGFLDAWPEITIRSVFVDRIVHLVDEGFDIAFRFAQLPDSGLTAVRLGRMRRVIAASPAYLARLGEPMTPAELDHHATIRLAREGSAALAWAFGDQAMKPAGSAPERLRPPSRLTVNTPEAAVAAAVAGHGLCRLFYYQVVDEVRAGRLSLVLTGHEPAPVPLQLVYPAGRKAAARVRAFVDFATEGLDRSEVLIR